MQPRPPGRTHIYSAARGRDAVMGQKVLEVLDHVCGGSPESLMVALIDDRGLNAAELKRIHALLEAATGRRRSCRRAGRHRAARGLASGVSGHCRHEKAAGRAGETRPGRRPRPNRHRWTHALPGDTSIIPVV
ncbi:MAG: BlaI/MecI/CopY family transcriptional regulator [Planctomycetia bacterium]|nr:BlaI/MecI/CopY family transcriptional regulator [Planctomycetia bacterium]